MRNLCLILSFDRPGSRRWRVCGKLAAASLLRSLWDGDIRVVRNYEQPLFPTGRQGLWEAVNPGFDHHNRLLGWRREAELGESLANAGLRGEAWQRQVAKEAARMLWFEELAALDEPGQYPWVLLMDADCVALRNPDHLFDRDGASVLVSDRARPDPGFVAVRGSVLKEVAAAWRARRAARPGDWEDGHARALSAALATGAWAVGEFEKGEVVRAGDPGVGLGGLKNAAVIHFGGMAPEDKRRLAFAFHAMAVYGDEDGLFLDMLES